MRTRKLKKMLERNFGKKPDVYYSAYDMEGIRTYFDYRRDRRLDDFCIDETTFHDLSMNDVFKRINPGLSTSGEQYLYYLLRSPAIEKSEYDSRLKLIELMEKNPAMRLKLQVILARLGRRRAASTCEAFHPSTHGLKKLFLYLLLVAALIGSAVGMAFTAKAAIPFIGMFIFLPVYHQIVSMRIEADLATVNYSVAMVFAQTKIKKLAFSELNDLLPGFYESGRRLRFISRIGGVSTNSMVNDLTAVFNTILLVDLITYELLKNKLGKRHEDIFHIHEYLGRIDAAIAIASYRKSLDEYVIPQLDFSGEVRYCGTDLVHPLIKDAVPNSVDSEKPILLTGSNASGKSVYLKTVSLNAMLAQSICTALGKGYSASAFRIYSSIAIADNILSGESYFISEIKSLKRIIDAAGMGGPILCVIDEVLRGTNTVERIAASSEVLSYLAGDNTLCLAATHDIELCELLKERYRLFHFEETIAQSGDILFDYKLKDGPATSRNALKLLDKMGFDKELVHRANEKANRYIRERTWI